MASAIDPNLPAIGIATITSVRNNFAAAKTEIEALQAATDVTGGGGLQTAIDAKAMRAGDLGGTVPSTLVIGLQGRAVAPTAPTAGQVLTYFGPDWRPTTPAGAGPGGVSDHIIYLGMGADVHAWIPFGTEGLFASVGTNVTNAPDTGTWRYLGWSDANLIGAQTILASKAETPGGRLLQKTCDNGVWSPWTEYASLNGQPNFAERDPTVADFDPTLNEAREGISGGGWGQQAGPGLDIVWTRAAGSGVGQLAFPINANLVGGQTVQISWTATTTAGTYIVYLRQSPTETAAQVNIGNQGTAATGPGGSTIVVRNEVVAPPIAFTHVVVVPDNAYAGTFKMNFVYRWGGTNVNSPSLFINGTPVRNRRSGADVTIGGGPYTNICIGSGGSLIGTGTENIGIGNGAMQSQINGSWCQAIGWRALFNNVGNGNLGIGIRSLWHTTTGTQNIGIGYEAGGRVGTGNYNMIFGYRSYYRAETATPAGQIDTYNHAIGHQGLYALASGNHNVTCGGIALYALTTGSNNTAIGGLNCGRYRGTGTSTLTTAENATFLGANARASASGLSNYTVIGYNAVGGGSNSVTLGNTSIDQLRCQVVAITSTSDARVKRDIENADLDLCVDAVKALPVRRFRWAEFMGNRRDRHVTGFVADDVEKVFPKSVNKTTEMFPVYRNGKPVTNRQHVVDAEGNQLEAQEDVPEMFDIVDVKNLTNDQALPTLWGAVQKLIQRNEKLEREVSNLRYALAAQNDELVSGED